MAYWFFMLMMLGSLQGCASLTITQAPPQVMPNIPLEQQKSQSLPPPENGKPLNVGIYNCYDTTGQRKDTSIGAAGFSTAVPQDCAPFLMAALRTLPHYRVLERSRVDDVLKERQLAVVMLGENTGRALGNMVLADVLMFGQIVSYDQTTKQSAGGIAINAIGAAHSQVSDTFTFSLRAVSTKTGEVLNEVLVKKSVESLQANGHILKIYGVDTYSMELGGASNEPAGIALQQSIALAVQTMTEKGMRAGWWHE